MSKKEINSHIGFIDENGKIVKIPEKIRKHIEAREEFWADKIKDIDIKCGIVLKRLELTNREITELEEKNDKLGTDLYNAENIVSDLQSQLEEKDQRIAELEEQLKNAIVPKFKVGDKCWAIRNATNIYNEPKQVLIKEITITKNCIKYYAKNGCLTNRTNKTTMHIQSQLFATKEEAQAKLKELKGE